MVRSTPNPGWVHVTKAWTASYTPALSVKRGERLSFGRTDPDNPGWQWAENRDGLGGWLPEAFIASDHMTRDFDSTELTVAESDRVRVLESLAGWHFCETEDGGRGWLPGSVIDAL